MSRNTEPKDLIAGLIMGLLAITFVATLGFLLSLDIWYIFVNASVTGVIFVMLSTWGSERLR